MKPFVTFLAGGVLVLGLAGCGEASDAPDEPPVDDEVAFRETLAGATYHTEFAPDSTVTLVRGRFEGEPAGPGAAAGVRVTLANKKAFGDLDGDSVTDAAVLLVSSPGGSGTFYELAVVLNRRGAPKNVATTVLGDRIKVNSLKIVNGRVAVDFVAHGPGDPMCCPSHDTTRAFTLSAGELTPTKE